jgi:hypothetical protein
MSLRHCYQKVLVAQKLSLYKVQFKIQDRTFISPISTIKKLSKLAKRGDNATKENAEIFTKNVSYEEALGNILKSFNEKRKSIKVTDAAEANRYLIVEHISCEKQNFALFNTKKLKIDLTKK